MSDSFLAVFAAQQKNGKKKFAVVLFFLDNFLSSLPSLGVRCVAFFS